MLSSNKSILILADVNSSHTKKWVISLCGNFDVSLYSLTAPKEPWIKNYPVRFKSFEANDDLSKQKSDRKKLVYYKAIKSLKAFYKDVDPELVHAHYATSYGMLARKLGHNKTIISVWGSDVLEFPNKSILHKFFLKRILKSAAIVCSTSKNMSLALNELGFKNVLIIPFGIDTNTFNCTTRQNKTYTIGTVKALEEVYGIDILLRVYAQYREISSVSSQLKIFGKGNQLADLKKLASELSIQDVVSFEGFIPHDNIKSAYEKLDVYCAFSRRESFGVAVLEAQSTELPVLCSNIGGLPEVCDPASGALFSLDQFSEAANHLKTLENEEIRIEKGKQARQFVCDNYDWSKSVEKMIAVYDKLA